MAPGKRTVGVDHSGDAKRQREARETDRAEQGYIAHVDSSAAARVLHRENATVGIESSDVPEEDFDAEALLVRALRERDEEDDDEEDDDETEDEEKKAPAPSFKRPSARTYKGPPRTFNVTGALHGMNANYSWGFNAGHSKTPRSRPNKTFVKEKASQMRAEGRKHLETFEAAEAYKEVGECVAHEVTQFDARNLDAELAPQNKDNEDEDESKAKRGIPLQFNGFEEYKSDESGDEEFEEILKAAEAADTRTPIATTAASTPPPIPSSKASPHPKWFPISHNPIYLYEPGHGRFKSRLVFEADPVPSEQHYIEVALSNDRMSALQKFKCWRDKMKLKDGDVRRGERLIILNEHEFCGSRHEIALYADTIKSLDSWHKRMMPDSLIIIRLTIPANKYTAAGRFRGLTDALLYVLEKYPFHFSVELENMDILDMNASQFYPTIADPEYNAAIQRKLLNDQRVLQIKNTDQATLQQRAEEHELYMRRLRATERGIAVSKLDVDWVAVHQRMENDIFQLREQIIAEIPTKLAAKRVKADHEIAHAKKFVTQVKYFHEKGHLPDIQMKPFVSMKPRKKKSTFSDGFIDPVKEAKEIATLFPWISEDEAKKYYENVAADSGVNNQPLEEEKTSVNPSGLLDNETIGFTASISTNFFGH
ncbi:hypothetical protein N0V90_003422 [Kalmusia sp. IMI 367209]|nr:hypothetical protein N0V90_003422 [Kalmusia sp. IMI 367209]